MNVDDAYQQVLAGQTEAQQRSDEVARCYRAVFYGQPTPYDQETVRDDLLAFCGMRRDMLRETFESTANELGRFRVWQRIHGFCFPTERKVTNGQGQEARHYPTPGGGLAERTED